MSTWATQGFTRAIVGSGLDAARISGVSSSEVKNLEAISAAIDQHNRTCPYPAAEVRMNPFEVERLGWDEIRGLPVVPDPEIGTGRFRIVCSREGEGLEWEETEAVGEPVEILTSPSPEKPPV
jgi:hypothetical protein